LEAEIIKKKLEQKKQNGGENKKTLITGGS
jgi:hypothetical protein